MTGPRGRRRKEPENKGLNGHFKRVIGFALVPAATMASTLLVLPLISRQFGADGWSAVGIGQSLGAFVSIIAGLGWQVIGAQQVAQSSPLQRQILFVESLKSRSTTLLFLLGPTAYVSYMLSPSFKLETIIFAAAMGLNCLNASWYFSGTGESRYVFLNEGLVRLCGYVLAIPVLAITHSLLSYAVILLVTGLLSAALNFSAILLPWNSHAWRESRSTFGTIMDQLSGALSRTLTAAQLHVGPTIVAILHPQSLHVFTALYNVHKAINNATAAYPQAFAWWVGSPKSMQVRVRRTNILAVMTLAIGGSILAFWVLLGSRILEWLYNGDLVVSFDLNLACGISMAMFAVSRAAGLLGLIPLGMQKAVYTSTSVSAVLCIGGMILGTSLLGTYGAFLAMAVSGVCLTGYLYVARARRASALLNS